MSSAFDVIVIGAGFAGLHQVHLLRDELGLEVRGIERGPEVGGTWYWNRYPGLRCDFESEFYSYSFNEEIQQEWDWPERYSAQPDILAYLNFVADRLDLRRSYDFDTEVTSLRFDEADDRWIVGTTTGATYTARWVVCATGPLSTPLTPDLEGLDSFAGELYHTASWPESPVDFTGKRVAVVGTGSSGIQVIPVIAEQASDLTVFQRTATFTVPAANRPLTAIERQETKRTYPKLRALLRESRAGLLLDGAIGTLESADPFMLRSELERRWRGAGGLGFTGVLKDALTSPAANEVIAQFVRDKISDIVQDPETARLLQPHEYPIGTKRMALDTGYFNTYNRPNVHLVSLREMPLERFTATGIVAGGKEFEFDAVVLATGFDAITGTLKRMGIEGVGGRGLADAWADGPSAYLGIMAHDFPNLFLVHGPGSPSALTNMVASGEQQVEWIAQFIARAEAEGVTRSDPDPQAEADWVAHVAQLAAHTLYPTAASWYMGANVPDKPRVFLVYLGGMDVYRATCDASARNGYAGFTHTHHGQPVTRKTMEDAA